MPYFYYVHGYISVWVYAMCVLAPREGAGSPLSGVTGSFGPLDVDAEYWSQVLSNSTKHPALFTWFPGFDRKCSSTTLMLGVWFSDNGTTMRGFEKVRRWDVIGWQGSFKTPYSWSYPTFCFLSLTSNQHSCVACFHSHGFLPKCIGPSDH